MMTAGVIEHQKVELVAGRIYAITDLPAHTSAVETFHEALRAMLPRDRWTIREEKPVLIGRYWAPKPDLSVLRGNHANFARRQARPRDVALLVEVSDTTYHRDRGQKWRRYAAAGIPVYVFVRLRGANTVIEVWTGPTGRGKLARYVDVVRYSARAAESVPIELDGNEHGQVALAELVARRP
jgi:hypothetical protein